MKITIEELISQEFEVPDGTTFEEVQRMYKNEELVVENGSLMSASVLMNECESWQKL